GAHRPGPGVAGGAPERAVVAAVPAQVGEREEDLRGEGEGAPPGGVSGGRGPGQEVGERAVREVGEGQGFVFGRRRSHGEDSPTEAARDQEAWGRGRRWAGARPLARSARRGRPTST